MVANGGGVMGDELVKKAETARATRDAASNELAALHVMMLGEMAASIPFGQTRSKYGTDLLRASFEPVNKPASIPEMVVESLALYGSVCAILPPRNGEGIEEHARRVKDWIAEKWRRDGMRW